MTREPLQPDPDDASRAIVVNHRDLIRCPDAIMSPRHWRELPSGSIACLHEIATMNAGEIPLEDLRAAANFASRRRRRA